MKTNKFSLILLAAVVVMLPACWGKKDETHEPSSLYVLNVLDKEYYDDCHIAGSLNVPFDQVESFAKGLDKSAEIVVYCSGYTCTASGQAVQQLKSMGFEKVYAYEAGMAEWYQRHSNNPGQYPIEGACAKHYLKAANQAPARAEEGSVVSTEALREKMIAHGLLAGQSSSSLDHTHDEDDSCCAH